MSTLTVCNSLKEINALYNFVGPEKAIEFLDEATGLGACFNIATSDEEQAIPAWALWDAGVEKIDSFGITISGQTECSGSGLSVTVHLSWNGDLQIKSISAEGYRDMNKDNLARENISNWKFFGYSGLMALQNCVMGNHA